jgi:hypothetical protein
MRLKQRPSESYPTFRRANRSSTTALEDPSELQEARRHIQSQKRWVSIGIPQLNTPLINYGPVPTIFIDDRACHGTIGGQRAGGGSSRKNGRPLSLAGALGLA